MGGIEETAANASLIFKIEDHSMQLNSQLTSHSYEEHASFFTNAAALLVITVDDIGNVKRVTALYR